MKKEKRVCVNCGGSYTPKKNWQIACTDLCYNEYVKKQRKIQKDLEKLSFPEFKCPRCGEITTLTFSPIADIKAWKEFKCGCGYTRIGDTSNY